MEKGQRQWLPHLENAIPKEAYGDKIDLYTMALEGWRRGLTLKFSRFQAKDGLKTYYSLSNEKREHTFSVTRGDKVSKEAIQICISKNRTKEYLEKAGVPVPSGGTFDARASDSVIVAETEDLGYPVVLKPTDGFRGKGVISNIRNKEELSEALTYVRQKLQYSNVIVEQYFPGEEFRLTVVGDRVIGAVNRIPANVTGNGESTIRQLIAAKNKERKKVPNLYARLIKVDNEVKSHIQKAGYTIDTVLPEGEQLFLRQKSNLSTGGDSVDVTDKLTLEVKQVAIDAVKAIPGLVQGGVDLIVNQETNEATVIEINSRAGVGAHLFPVYGQARDIPAAIMDYYFPETASNPGSKKNSSLYFDLQSILDMIRSGKTEEIIVRKAPPYHPILKSYTVSGKLTRAGYKQWVRREALRLKLHGFVESNSSGEVLIVIAGSRDRVEEFGVLLETEAPRRATIDQMAEQTWRKPVPIGFTIKRKGKTAGQENEELAEQLQEAEAKAELLSRELEAEKKERKEEAARHMRELEKLAGQVEEVRKKKRGFFSQ